MSETIVVVGAGQAAGQLVASLNNAKHDGQVVLVGDEPHAPYQRPPLSKQVLAGEVGVDRVFVKPAEFYAESGVDLRLNKRVESIDRQARNVTLGDGTSLSYDKLVLATGSRVRTLDLPGSDLAGIHYLRTLDDMQSLKSGLEAGGSLVVVGGGYIGLEVASVAVKMGLKVTVLEMAERLMSRVVGNEIAACYDAIHREAGVDIRTGSRVTAFEGDGSVIHVLCGDGERLPADRVVVGVGILPNAELAQTAGLEVDNGVVVDEFAVTSDSNILAIGDCTNHPSARYDRRVRLESVPNALAQARTAAALLCGERKAYVEPPWFWSDQYDLKLQIVGFTEGHDEKLIRGDVAARKFIVCYLQSGELLAAEAVNNPRDFMVCRQLVASRAAIDRDKLVDESVPMKEVAG